MGEREKKLILKCASYKREISFENRLREREEDDDGWEEGGGRESATKGEREKRVKSRKVNKWKR